MINDSGKERWDSKSVLSVDVGRWKRLCVQLNRHFLIYSDNYILHKCITFLKLRMYSKFFSLVYSFMRVFCREVHFADNQSHFLWMLKISDTVGCSDYQPVSDNRSTAVVHVFACNSMICLNVHLFDNRENPLYIYNRGNILWSWLILSFGYVIAFLKSWPKAWNTFATGPLLLSILPANLFNKCIFNGSDKQHKNY